MSTPSTAVAAKLSSSPSPMMSAAEKHVDEEIGDAKSSVEKPSPNGVNWDSDDDPLNPMHWKTSKKWLNLVVIAMMAFITYVARCEAAIR